MNTLKETSYNKKEEHSILQVNVASKLSGDTLMLKSVYFFNND